MVIFATVLVAAEVSGALIFKWKYNYFPYLNLLKNEKKNSIPDHLNLRSIVFHPYLGYVNGYKRIEEEYSQKSNPLGFMQFYSVTQNSKLIKENLNSKTKIGIFGGSVATDFAHFLQKKQASAGTWESYYIDVQNYAIPGYKQPQNLFALMYSILLGEKLDIVINLDGFNEIITGFTNQIEMEQVIYPASSIWRSMALELISRLEPQSSFKILKEKCIEKMQKDEKNANHGLSFIINGIKKIIIKAFFELIEKTTLEMTKPNNSDYFPNTPRSLLTPKESVLERSKEIWLNSSKAMFSISNTFGIEYFHFFQPNQWDKRNGIYKPISENHNYKWVIPFVEAGYKEFSKATNIKTYKGFEIYDCAGILNNAEARKFWIDDCCHLTEFGNEILWNYIRKKINLENKKNEN